LEKHSSATQHAAKIAHDNGKIHDCVEHDISPQGAAVRDECDLSMGPYE
jgi:hypothetical protein